MNQQPVSLSKQPKLGKREQNKIEKIRRIKEAAAELFTKKGFDAATTDEIAKRAKVAKGTLFLYAHDKRDLVFLIFDDEVTRISRRAFAQPKPDMPLLEQLVSVGASMYRDYSRNVPLSRILLAELYFYRGKLARHFRETRQRVVDGYERLLSDAQSSGKLRNDVDVKLAAMHIFLVISGALRYWLDNDRPNYAEGLAKLRELLGLSLRGLSPAASVGGVARSSLDMPEKKLADSDSSPL